MPEEKDYNMGKVVIINKRTKEEFYDYLKNNYSYEAVSGIVPCDLCRFNYEVGVISNKPVVYKLQHHPKWFKGRYTVEFLDPKVWEFKSV